MTVIRPPDLPAKPNKTFFTNWVKGAFTQTPGIGAIERARAGTKIDGTTMEGRTYQQILDASRKQGFSFEPNSYNYLMDKIQEDRQAANEQRMADYEKAQADRQAELEEKYNEQLKQLQISQQTMQQNAARSGAMGSLQIAGAAQDRRSGGTQGFKRRKLQINPVTSNALSSNATSTNILNV